jgi:hypothetical protein
MLISQQGEYSIRLVGCKSPYPVIYKNDIPVSPLFNNDIPLFIAEKFWTLMREYNIFLEVEMEEEEEGYE